MNRRNTSLIFRKDIYLIYAKKTIFRSMRLKPSILVLLHKKECFLNFCTPMDYCTSIISYYECTRASTFISSLMLGEVFFYLMKYSEVALYQSVTKPITSR